MDGFMYGLKPVPFMLLRLKLAPFVLLRLMPVPFGLLWHFQDRLG